MEDNTTQKEQTVPIVDSAKQQYAVPGAIILAGIIIAGAIVLSGGVSEGSLSQEQGTQNGQIQEEDGNAFGNNNSATAENVREVTQTDHTLGSSDAKITIVEYSDFECPFCGQLHPTLERIVDEYDGDVRWVYRHFPLTSIHSRALSASMASECVAELSGNDAFWDYGSKLFENQRSLSPELYTSLAQEVGVDEAEFTECLESERHRDRVSLDQQNAVESGGRGTPFSIVITSDGEVFPFSGALPYENVKQIVDAALAS